MLMSKEANESCDIFIESLMNDELKLDLEPQIQDGVELTEEFCQEKLNSYKSFLKSDICTKIFDICN